MTATSQPAAAASASRADSSAVCTPRRRCAGHGRRAGELRDALGYPHGGAADDDPVAQRGVAHVAGRGRIALGSDDRLARELLVPGHPLRVGVDGALGHDVKPGLELLLTARPDLDPRWHHPLGFTREGTAEHVFERFEPVTPPGQQGADRGVGQMGEFDLHGGTAVGEGLLDFIESGRIRHAAEAESRDLVVRRTLPGEARHAARNRDHKARRACPAAGGLAAFGR